jgi:hypothetical protein
MFLYCTETLITLYFSDAFENRMSVAILRLPDGQDYSKLAEEVEPHAYYNNAFSLDSSHQDLTKEHRTSFLRVDSNPYMAQVSNNSSDISLPVIGKQQCFFILRHAVLLHK